MIDQLKPYPRMKESGVEWLGEVPEHWEVRRLRNVAGLRVSNIDKHSRDGEEPVRLCNYVDVYKHDRITPEMTFMKATATQADVERFRLHVDDVLITKDSEAWNDIGVPSLVDGTADDLVSGYHLALLRPFQDRIKGGFLFRVLQSSAGAYQFHVEATGVTRYGLSHGSIKSVFLPVPPLPEQTAIVRLLDYADRRIRRYIRAKQKLIKLLEEQKQAITHRAVTRGLDPEVPLKDSGVEWLEEVPEHWEVVPLRWYTSIGSGDFIVSESVFHTPSDQKGVPVIGGNGVMGYTDRSNSADPVIVIGRVGALCGNVHLVTRPAWVTDNALRVTRIRGFEPEYLALQLRVRDLNRLANASAQPLITAGMVKEQRAVRPTVEDQRRIVLEVKDATTDVDLAIVSATREVALLGEYRTRLIADVVTGKLDVREAEARLPDEIDEPALLDGSENGREVDEATADDLDTVLKEVEA